MFTSLPSEIVFYIYRHLRLSLWPGDDQDRPKNDELLALSSTCSYLRTIGLPILFKETYNWRIGITRYSRRYINYHARSNEKVIHLPPPNELWPPTLWPYIQKLHVQDFISRGKLDFMALQPVLPHLVNLNHLRLKLVTSPPEALLLSASTLSQLTTLELSDSRLDGPSLVHAFSRLCHLSSLILTVKDKRPSNINVVEERKNVADILRNLGPTISHLTVAGDLIDFETLTTIKWPRLRTLRLVNHVPMERLYRFRSSCRKCHCCALLDTNDFSAGAEHRDSTIFCFDGEGNLTSPRLSSVLPGLTSLSISNIQTEDRIVEQLPLSLQALRVVARRDPCYPASRSDPYRYHYSSLDEIDTLRWIDAAAKLTYLVELALTLKNAPSPTVLAAISLACPQLRILELEQASFEENVKMSPYATESLVEPLIQLHDLRNLRITLEIGVHNSPERMHYVSIFDESVAKRSLLQETGLLFAKRLRSLESISFSYHNASLSLYDLDRHSVWYKMDVVREENGQPPFVQFSMYV